MALQHFYLRVVLLRRSVPAKTDYCLSWSDGSIVNAVWTNLAYPSLRPLGSWLVNLMQRVTQLVEWTTDLGVPKSVWLPGLFNPQSFLTAVMQVRIRLMLHLFA